MSVKTHSVDGSPTVEVSVYHTTQLDNSTGLTAPSVAATYIAGALEKAGFGADVHYGFDPIPMPTETSHCAGGNQRRFNQRKDELPVTAKDSNVLLTNSRGGGCGYIGGDACVAPGGHLRREIPYRETGEGDLHNNLHAVLHEVGHNLGARHDHNDRWEGKQHWGFAENRPYTWRGFELPWLGGKWIRTPCVAGNGCFNDCGEWIEPRRYDREIHAQYYHSCAVSRFKIE